MPRSELMKLAAFDRQERRFCIHDIEQRQQLITRQIDGADRALPGRGAWLWLRLRFGRGRRRFGKQHLGQIMPVEAVGCFNNRPIAADALARSPSLSDACKRSSGASFAFNPVDKPRAAASLMTAPQNGISSSGSFFSALGGGLSSFEAIARMVSTVLSSPLSLSLIFSGAE